MKSKTDLIIEKLIRHKFRTIESAKKDIRISKLLRDGMDITSLSKRDKASLIQILNS